MARQVVILANSRILEKRSLLRLRGVLDTQAPSLSWRVEEVADPADVQKAVEKLHDTDLPVAAGGDGTVNMLASALHRLETPSRPMGILPMGTGNLLARDLGLGGLATAARILASGSPTPVDVLLTDRDAFPLALVSVSGGFEGAFLTRFERGRRLGKAVGLALGLLASRRRWALELLLDGASLLPRGTPAYAAGLYNTSCYAGGVVMSPGADPTDGVVDAVGYTSAKAYWRAIARGVRTRPGSAAGRNGIGDTAGKARRRDWETAVLRGEGSFQIDGEPVAGGEISVRLERGGLTLLTPPWSLAGVPA